MVFSVSANRPVGSMDVVGLALQYPYQLSPSFAGSWAVKRPAVGA